MKKVGVVVDSWKVPIFRKIFDDNGFKYKIIINNDDLIGTTTLMVMTETIAELQPFVEQANNKAARSKGH